MIQTKQPANQFFVYATAYRAGRTQEVNEMMLKSMIKEIRKFPGLYGVIEDEFVAGSFREEGATEATVERTLRIRCRNEVEADNVAFLACDKHGQDAVLEVVSQTHKATLVTYRRKGSHGEVYRSRTEIGTLMPVREAQGECWSVDKFGQVWEVL